jgi:uncharacterized protein (TIGR03437 family)
LPDTLEGVSVTITDSAGVQSKAPLVFVSPGQINLAVPDGMATGVATFAVTGNGGGQNFAASIQGAAPALFSMNGTGTGVAAATAIRVQASNPLLQSPLTVFQCGASGCESVAIALGVDTPVYVTLYGTGIRNRSSLAAVSVSIGGVSVPVSYAGPKPRFAGLDRVNVSLPLSLRGAGESNVVVTVDGQPSNAVTIHIQ